MFHKLFIPLISIALASCAAPQYATVDVLVVGGGASGTCAAIAAAREGVRVALVEEGPWLGGMLTSAGVSAMDGNYAMRGGLFGEFCDSLASRYGGYEALKTGWVSNILFEPHTGAEVFRNMAAQYGNLQVDFDTRVRSFRKDGEGWRVTTVQKGRKRIYRASILIDATELGDVAAATGVKYDVGMDSRAATGEKIAPQEANGIVQDLTYVAVLKDYGPDADRTIEPPADYSPQLYYRSCKSEHCADALWTARQMLDYGRLPGGKYMINWPISGNDCYMNIVELSPRERLERLRKAKNVTLGFVYYIQTCLGFKNLGLADDEFTTPDRLALIPYYRESRRTKGKVRLTVDDVAAPYDRPDKLYRTGIGVGDYPVDHHHGRYEGADSLPDLHFHPVPSFSMPLGCLIPQDVENLIVAEKSVSVSNIVNGTTRLQPVVMQIGQAAGITAAMAVAKGVKPSEVEVRDVQEAVLDSGGYIMPYLDLPPSDKSFKALQRIGATGIMRGEGKTVGWSNQTWFDAFGQACGAEIAEGLAEYYPAADFAGINRGALTVADLIEIIGRAEGRKTVTEESWSAAGLSGFDVSRAVSRAEAAVIIDFTLRPFQTFGVDYSGNLKNRSK